MQRIEGLMRRAIEDYTMIEEGDKIAVALSGGKDSITLLYALKNLQRYYPKLDEKIAQTYVRGTSANNANKLYDSYIRAFRCNLLKKSSGMERKSNIFWTDGLPYWFLSDPCR